MTQRAIPWRLCAVVLAIGVVLAVGYATGATRYFSLAELGRRRETLEAFVHAHPLQSLGLYVGVYFASILMFLPVMTVMLVGGGLLFGVALASSVAVATALAGAVVVFLAARTALGSALRDRVPSGSLMEKMETGLRRHAFSYLLTSRLVPVFPFSVVSVVAGSIQIPLRAFAAATLIGLLPPALVYTALGAGLGAVLDRGGHADLTLLTHPGVLGPLLLLAALSLTPHLYRAWRGGLRPKSPPPASR